MSLVTSAPPYRPGAVLARSPRIARRAPPYPALLSPRAAAGLPAERRGAGAAAARVVPVWAPRGRAGCAAEPVPPLGARVRRCRAARGACAVPRRGGEESGAVVAAAGRGVPGGWSQRLPGEDLAGKG